ncbi:MAG: hypothetical protein ACJ754_17105 [Pyrinomonadaceae bacterium]
MNHRHLMMTAISLFLGLTPLAIGESKAHGRGRGATAKAGGDSATTQRRSGRQTRRKEPAPRAQTFSKDLNELRAQFNRDKGQVRILMLLSPT